MPRPVKGLLQIQEYRDAKFLVPEISLANICLRGRGTLKQFHDFHFLGWLDPRVVRYLVLSEHRGEMIKLKLIVFRAASKSSGGPLFPPVFLFLSVSIIFSICASSLYIKPFCHLSFSQVRLPYLIAIILYCLDHQTVCSTLAKT